MVPFYRRPRTMSIRALKLYTRRHARQLGHEMDVLSELPASDVDGYTRLAWQASSTTKAGESLTLEVEIHDDGKVRRWRLKTNNLSRPPGLDLEWEEERWSDILIAASSGR